MSDFILITLRLFLAVRKHYEPHCSRRMNYQAINHFHFVKVNIYFASAKILKSKWRCYTFMMGLGRNNRTNFLLLYYAYSIRCRDPSFCKLLYHPNATEKMTTCHDDSFAMVGIKHSTRKNQFNNSNKAYNSRRIQRDVTMTLTKGITTKRRVVRYCNEMKKGWMVFRTENKYRCANERKSTRLFPAVTLIFLRLASFSLILKNF